MVITSVPNVATCSLHFLSRPQHLLPWHAGSQLNDSEKKERFEYYVSSILWLIFGSYVFGQLLTVLGRAGRSFVARMLHGSEPSFALLSDELAPTEDDVKDAPDSRWLSIFWQLTLHGFCASLAFLSTATGRVDVHNGLCWEIYEFWAMVMLTCSLLQAVALIFSLPLDRQLPYLGFPTIEAVLPILGEPLDIFKDWLFVGVAASTESILGYILAALGVLVLFVSGTYVQAFHSADLFKQLLPLQAVAYRKRSLLDAQTSTAKLAVAMTEDLPQSLLQALFVVGFGGSATVFFFIMTSCFRIFACLLIRPCVLSVEKRDAEAEEARAHLQQFDFRLTQIILGSHHPRTLISQSCWAEYLDGLGRTEEACLMRQEILEAWTEMLGPHHPETLQAQHDLAVNLWNLGRNEEAFRMEQEALEAQREVLGRWSQCVPNRALLCLWRKDRIGCAGQRPSRQCGAD